MVSTAVWPHVVNSGVIHMLLPVSRGEVEEPEVILIVAEARIRDETAPVLLRHTKSGPLAVCLEVGVVCAISPENPKSVPGTIVCRSVPCSGGWPDGDASCIEALCPRDTGGAVTLLLWEYILPEPLIALESLSGCGEEI